MFNAIGKFHAQSGESQLLDKLDKRYKKLEKTFVDILHSLGTETNSAEENISENKKEDQSAETEKSSKKSLKGEQVITIGMDDKNRYDILKKRSITLSAHTNSNLLNSVMQRLEITDSKIEFSKYGDRVRLFKKLGKEFGTYHQYTNPDIKLDFHFSREKMRESVSKQQKNYSLLAKMLTCLDNVVSNAIGIEVHNRNYDGYKVDDTLKNVYVLASAFIDGNDIIPVKLEVKEFLDKNNTLHVAIALESIKRDGIVKQEVANEGVARQYSPPSSISIPEFFAKINPSDESFLKYIPDGFLDADQKQSKYRALEKDGMKKSLKDTSSIESREAIVRSFGELAATDGEKKIVKDYAKSIEKIDKSIEKKKELFLGLQELKGKTDSESKAQREKYSAEIQRINDEITKADESLLKIAAAEPFRNVVRKSFESGYDKGFDAREGYILKTIAKHSHSRYYNKKDVAAAIEKAPKVDTLTHKRRGELADELTNKLNKAKNDGERAVITKDFIEKIQGEIITNDKNGVLKDLSERELSNWKRSLVDALMDLYRKASKPGEFAGGVEAFIERQKHLLEKYRDSY